MNFCKGLIVKLRPRAKEADRLRYMFPRCAGAVVDLHACSAPDDDLVKKYEHIRRAEAHRIAIITDEVAQAQAKERRITYKTQILEATEKKRPPRERKARAAYVKALAKTIGCGVQNVRTVLGENGF